MTATAGVDVGGTKVLAAAVDESGNILERVFRQTDPSAGSASLLGALEDLIAGSSVSAIGVGVAAWVEYPSGRVIFAPNLHYELPELKTVVTERFGLPVTVENDANAAAWGEREYGSGVRAKHMLMVTVGTGIGGGIVIHGRLLRGSRGLAGEIGHMTILERGPRCACGQQGCLEALASGTAIARMAKERLEAGETSGLIELVSGDLGNITGALVSEASASGDSLARSILEEAGTYLGVGLASLTQLLDPELIVVGGSGSQAHEVFLSAARSELDLKMGGRREVPKVVPAALGNDAGVIGAASLARLM